MPTGCSVTGVVTVSTMPAVIGGPTAVCNGDVITLTDATSGGSWSSSAVSVAVIGSTSGLLTGAGSGTSIVSYTMPSGCRRTVIITVNVMPGAIGGSLIVCSGSTTSLTNTVAGGTWTSTTPATGSVSALGVVTGVAAGTTTISYALSSGCFKTAIATVNSLPAAITGISTVCEGSTRTLTSGPAGGTWTSSNGTLATVGSASGIVSGVTAGTPTITYTLSTGCIRTTTFTVNPLPAAITGASSVCEGSSITLNTTTAGGSWSSSTPTATVGTTGIVLGAAAGTAAISYTSVLGCGVAKMITVYALPSAISGTANVCVGSAHTLSSGPTGGTWSSSASAIGTIGSASGIVSGISGGTTQITYQLPTGCQRAITFTVNDLPAAISGTGEVCAGNTLSLSSATSGGAWSSAATSTASVDATSGIVTGIAAGIATIFYATPAGCSRSTVVTVDAVPAAITGASTVCTGATVALTSTTTGGTWSSGSTLTATIGAATGIVSGVAVGTSLVSYTLSTGCAATVVVSVSTIPSAGSISGADTVCLQNTVQLTNPATGGTWSSSDAAVATVSTGGLVTGVGVGSTTITYTVTNSCGSATTTHVLVVKPQGECATYIKNAGKEEGFRLYPNPAYGAFSVETSVAGTMSVSSVDGKEIGIYQLKAAVNSLTLPKGIASGIYMCRFTGNDGSTQVIRLIYEP